MKVLELAQQYNLAPDEILNTLKSLRLKAKDADQELSAVVVSVLRDALSKKNIQPVVAIKEEQDEEVKKKPKVKRVVKKKTEEDKDKKPAPKKKKVAKKVEVAEKEVKDVEDKQDSLSEVPVELKVVKAEEVVEKKIDKEVEVTSIVPEKIEPKSEEHRKKEKVQDFVGKIDKKDIKIDKLEPQQSEGKDSFKSKKKIGPAPLITLKPLARKKKKQSGQSRMDNRFGRDSSSGKDNIKMPDVEVKRDPNEPLVDMEINVPISVKDFSVKVGQKPSVVLTHLMRMGIMAHINQGLEADVVEYLAKAFGFNYLKIRTREEQLIDDHKKEEEDPEKLVTRAPVVTFMGHVDHGKTSLLDKIRAAKVADSEHGGITQHMGAYSVNLSRGRITFLDTPGHEAFTAMRARGAHITDVVVLVVAADEGIMPQTQEAIDHARAANVPIIVALNKIDKRNADLDMVKKQLAENNLMSEDWGGSTICCGVSAVTGAGIDQLLEMILLEAEMLELKANPNKKASGIVVEAHLHQGKGVVTSVIVQSGTLKEGDYVVVGPYYGKVRAMLDDREKNVTEAGPSMPVEILGLPDVPEAGELFYVVEDEKKAREIAYKRRDEIKNKKFQSSNRITLEDLYGQMEQGTIKEVNVIMKADVQGSLEALKDSLEKIPSDKVRIKFIHLGVGDINASDVLLAVASNAIIIGFHVSIGPRAKAELEKEPVEIRQYRIIYDAVNDMKKALEGMLEAKTRKKFSGRVEIRQVFKLSKSGTVAGCYVLKGKVKRKDHLDVIRGEEIVYSGILNTLRRFKDDAREVTEGMECGIYLDGFSAFEVGDIIETYELEKIAQKL